MQFYDISNPYNPRLIGSVPTGTNPQNIWVNGRYAYVDDNSATTLSIFDLGGTYSASLQAGGLQAGSIGVDTNALINGYLSVGGGVQVGGSEAVSGSLNVYSASSVSALQVAGSTATILTVNTTANDVIIGKGSTGDATGYLIVLDSKTGAITDPTYIQGAMYYNATSNTFRCGVNGAWQDCAVGFDYANVAAGTTINGNTAGLQTLGATGSVPANYCTAGRDIHIFANGIYTTTTTAQPISFTIQMGTTSIGVSSSAFTPGNGITNAAWTLDYHIICNAAPSGSSAVTGEGFVTMYPTPSANTSALESIPLFTTSYATTNVATNAAQAIKVGATFTGTANAANTIVYNQYIVNAQ